MEGVLMKNGKRVFLNDLQLAFETPDDGFSYFFGYYDKSPLSKDNSKLLAHRVRFDGRDVQDGDIAEVGYFKMGEKEFFRIGETLAWNWQMGSQLQWLHQHSDRKIIYNKVSDGKFVAIIFDIDKNQEQIVPFPIYVVHPNGKEALGINFERLAWCRPGYDYKNILNKKWDRPYHEEDGIFRINLTTNEVKLIVPISKVVNHRRRADFEICNNWLEHLMYSPNGDNFLFFHRWHNNGKDYSRVYTADSSDGSNLFMYPDVEFYSHYSWRDNESFSIWTYCHAPMIKHLDRIGISPGKDSCLKTFLCYLRSVLKSLLPTSIVTSLQRHSELLVFTIGTNNYEVLAFEKLPANGHQSWFKGKRKILIDSYQDKDSYRSLVVFDSQKLQQKTLGRFFSQYNDVGYRCDLHPRLSLDNNFVIIDSCHNLKRKILVLKLNKSDKDA